MPRELASDVGAVVVAPDYDTAYPSPSTRPTTSPPGRTRTGTERGWDGSRLSVVGGYSAGAKRGRRHRPPLPRRRPPGYPYTRRSRSLARRSPDSATTSPTPTPRPAREGPPAAPSAKPERYPRRLLKPRNNAGSEPRHRSRPATSRVRPSTTGARARSRCAHRPRHPRVPRPRPRPRRRGRRHLHHDPWSLVRHPPPLTPPTGPTGQPDHPPPLLTPLAPAATLLSASPLRWPVCCLRCPELLGLEIH